ERLRRGIPLLTPPRRGATGPGYDRFVAQAPDPAKGNRDPGSRGGGRAQAPPWKPLPFRRLDRLAALGRSLDFIREISPDDDMAGVGPEEYYRWGLAALDYIQVALRTAEYPGAPRTILDLPCGYGRVLRMLRAAFPNATIHACDIKADALDFCTQT